MPLFFVLKAFIPFLLETDSIIFNYTGAITYVGTSEITKGNHNNMPSRTEAYRETDERGHIQASSLSGSNKSNNVVHYDSYLK